MGKEQEFVSGLFAWPPHPKAPDFVKCSLSINRESMIKWLQERDEEWINLQVKESKEGGKWYASVNNYKSDANWDGRDKAQAALEPEQSDDEIPI